MDSGLRRKDGISLNVSGFRPSPERRNVSLNVSFFWIPAFAGKTECFIECFIVFFIEFFSGFRPSPERRNFIECFISGFRPSPERRNVSLNVSLYVSLNVSLYLNGFRPSPERRRVSFRLLDLSTSRPLDFPTSRLPHYLINYSCKFGVPDYSMLLEKCLIAGFALTQERYTSLYPTLIKR